MAVMLPFMTPTLVRSSHVAHIKALLNELNAAPAYKNIVLYIAFYASIIIVSNIRRDIVLVKYLEKYSIIYN